MVLYACLIELLAAGVRGVFHVPTLVGHGAAARFGSYGLALLVQSALIFALGAMAGIATLPFAEETGSLLRRSVSHFLLTALFYSLLLVFCFDLIPGLLPGWLGMLLILYMVIWLGRWVSWYVELLDIREKLGLTPAPSRWKWRETAPYLVFLLFLCVVLPLLARWWNPMDVPVLTQLFLPYLALPVGCFGAGMSLGKRQGFCPLYPLGALVLFQPNVFPVYNFSALVECALITAAALLGNLLGALVRKRKEN